MQIEYGRHDIVLDFQVLTSVYCQKRINVNVKSKSITVQCVTMISTPFMKINNQRITTYQIYMIFWLIFSSYFVAFLGNSISINSPKGKLISIKWATYSVSVTMISTPFMKINNQRITAYRIYMIFWLIFYSYFVAFLGDSISINRPKCKPISIQWARCCSQIYISYTKYRHTNVPCTGVHKPCTGVPMIHCEVDHQ